MRRPALATFALAATAVASLAISACGDDDDTKDARSLADSILDDVGASDAVRDIVADHLDDIEDGDDIGASFSAKLPADFPDEIPVPDWKVVQATSVPTESGTAYSVVFDAPVGAADAIDEITAAAEGAGFTDSGRTVTGSGDEVSAVLAFEDDDYTWGATVGGTEAGSSVVSIVVTPR